MLVRLGEWCANVAIRYRWPVLVLSLLPLLGAWTALTLESNESMKTWFLENDPTLLSYEHFHDLFGNDEFLLVALEAESGTVFTNDHLASVERTTRFLEDHVDVHRVQSLTRYETVRGDGDDLVVERPLAGLPLSDAELAAARDRLLVDRVAQQSVVASAGRVATLVAELRYREDTFRYRNQLLSDVREWMDTETAATGFRYGVMGASVLDYEIYRSSRRDVARATPVVALVIALILGFATRSWMGVVLPLGVVGSSIIVARLAMAAVGWRDNSILIIMPIVVLAIGTADSVHIVVHYLRLRGTGQNAPDAARETVRRLFRPCFITTFTTAIGFAALLTADLAPLRQLGTLAGLGVITALYYSIFPLTAVLSLLPGTYHGHAEKLGRGPFARLSESLPGFTRRHRISILAGAGVLTIVALVGMPRLEVEANAIELFDRDDPVRMEGEHMEEIAGGISSMEILISAKTEGGIHDPEVLRAMDKLREYMETEYLVSGSSSVVDVLKDMNRALHGDDDAYHVIPESPDEIAQYLLLYDLSAQQGMGSMLDITHTHARLWSRTRFGASSEYRDFQARVQAQSDALFPESVDVSQTGLLILSKNMGDYLVRSQIRSFLFALVCIGITMVLTFRSLRFGLLSMIPNVWPIALTVGFMGWSGIWLNPATAMVAAVTIGIAVDDSVHFLAKYIEARETGADREAAVGYAFDISGKAIVFTTVVLLAGFGVITASEFRPYVEFGILCCMAIFFALVGDLLVLPALLQNRRARSGSRAPAAAAVGAGLLALLLLPTAPGAQEDPVGRGRAVMEALDRADDAVNAETIDATMILRDKGGREVTRRATLAFLEQDGDFRSLIRFEEPADIRGTAFLTSRKSGKEDRWLFLPALDRAKRIAGASQSGSFAGTELSYEDLSGRELDDYEYRWVREESVDGEASDVVESRPLDPDSGYRRILTWVSRERRVVLVAEYYDRDDVLLKRSVAGDWEQPDDTHWRFGTMTVENLQTGKSTVLVAKDRELGADLEPSDFTVEALRSAW